ncbi:E3 ubiquitin-protein ligase Ubr3 [Araneus ventricosus]|uniref:E3 ubiquitin-protein ligase n=1 Tax=Araneus ventricosus TaxID=182803 RepID=A0A4Y2G072_ARAVE|nr:E3 ubiquitin-protein ligase Ubr3 [Araneus ventricosus]GBM46723.1 E3 ubiquitin-protein ligase Ubr3 [Araneus ventricosus]
MAAEAADVLIKKGKRATAAYIQGVCSSQNNSDITNEVFDSILNPLVPINDWDSIDWCKWLLSGGKTPDDYTQTVRRYDNATTCGLVWTANFVAYRCRTCGISPCMSLCSECFQRGDHKGHDFNMFRSQAGGACDCGDKSVMKESGFCQRHGLQNQRNKPEAPPDLLCVAEVLMPRLFLRLVQHLRENSEPAFLDTHHTAMHFADGFLSLLQSHSEMGAAMRSVMTQALTNPQIYYMLAVDCETGNHLQYRRESLSQYLNARNSLQSSDEDISSSDADRTTWYTAEHLKQSSFLDELVFWTIKFEFPQKLVCLLLNMMPDLTYKEAFTKIFVKHYGLISKMLSKSKDSETLSNRVVHVSVQLFSNEDLAYQMTKDYDLLQIMVDSLFSMMLSISQKSTLQCPEKNEHLVVDCGHHIMKEHCYWPLVSDLNNVLTHGAVAHEFLSDPCLLNQWFKFLSLFQGMNVNQRELKAHVEFESNTYYAAFSAELEASATPMWALISHLKSPEMLGKTKAVLAACLEALQNWFTAINFSVGDEINPYQVSFHIPLHRCYASFLGQAVRQQGAQIDTLLPPDDTLKLMMMHPIQAQVTFHEILCNMWVRSGLQIKGQAMTYIQCHFCNSIVDADLFLLQLCAMKLDPDWFLKTIMQRFHVWEWLTFHPNRSNTFLDSDKVMPMLEGALSFLTTLLSTHTNIGLSEEKVIRQEMVSLLCMNDRTHSQLMDLIPDKCGETSQNKNFETILNQVAVYKAPNFEANGAMMQGTYVPKPEIWEEEYDPIHVLLRAVHRREYQASLDRFSSYLRQNNKLSSSRPPWPPFRIPPPVFDQFQDPRRILHCKTMHGIIFTILYRAVNDPDLPEQILSFCIYLLDMAVRFPSSEYSTTMRSDSKEVEDLKYEDWFDSSNILQNISKTIDSVVITEKVVMSMRMVEEMEVDEEVEEEMEMGPDGYTVYDVPSPIIEEDYQDPSNQHPPLPSADTQLALPSTSTVTTAVATTSSNYTQLVPFPNSVNSLLVMPSTSAAASASGSSGPQDSTRQQLALPASSSSYNMALIPTSEGLTTVRPKCMKLKQVPGRHRMLLSDKGLPLAIGSSESESCSGEQRYHSFSNKRTINVHESILSLLLQLHSKLSEKPDSYKPKENMSFEELNSRIGDGVLFVERLLNQVVISGGDNLNAIQNVRQKLWPRKIDVNASPSSENIDKEERRRRAKERQQKLMAEFASKQKAFMQKTMETDSKEGTSGVEEVVEDTQKEYECVICSQMSASEEDRPVGMVVLLQATSVAGHYHQVPNRTLPCDEKDRGELLKGDNMSSIVKNKIELLERYFNNRYWPMALNIGWEGGVHVQTCGHYLHIDCHKAYILSLKNQNQLSSRLQNLAVEHGEYYCPLCRQLANSVIPLRPGYREASALVQYPRKDLRILASEISDLLSTPLSERDSNLLKKYMGGIMEDITNATYPQYRSLCAPNPSSLFLFVCSIARTNLEVELVQRGRLFEPLKKKSCFVPLLNVLYLHSRLLSQTIDKSQQMDYAVKVWSRLTGQIPADHNSLTFFAVEVPLFLRDPIAVLLQTILTLPTNLDKSYYRCVTQVLYNFILIQSLVQISCRLNGLNRNELSFRAMQILKDIEECTDDEKNEELDNKMKDTKTLLGYVIGCLKYSCLYVEDDEMDSSKCISNVGGEGLEQYVREHCLHFLKIAALLQSHLFEEKINLKADDDEFHYLCQFLGLSSLPKPEFTAASCIDWTVSDPRDLIRTWCDDYINFINLSVIAARGLLQTHIKWHPPALLLLPHNYDDIFKYYHKKPCTVCHSEPKDPSLCLICGTMVCLRENCCRQLAHYEAVSHSVTCGAGTAIYLAVNSSTIIVIRGKRACLWGSVYLDSYGEEDRDLKRGKPLFLSEERYSLLQQQWINHSFDHTNKRWVWHKDNL